MRDAGISAVSLAEPRAPPSPDEGNRVELARSWRIATPPNHGPRSLRLGELPVPPELSSPPTMG